MEVNARYAAKADAFYAGPSDVPGLGRFAVRADSGGASFGMVQPS